MLDVIKKYGLFVLLSLALIGVYFTDYSARQSAKTEFQKVRHKLNEANGKIDFLNGQLQANRTTLSLGTIASMETRIRAVEEEWEAIPAGVVLYVVDPTKPPAKTTPSPPNPPTPSPPAVTENPASAWKDAMERQMKDRWLPLNESATPNEGAKKRRDDYEELARNLEGQDLRDGSDFVLKSPPPANYRSFVRTRSFKPPPFISPKPSPGGAGS